MWMNVMEWWSDLNSPSENESVCLHFLNAWNLHMKERGAGAVNLDHDVEAKDQGV